MLKKQFRININYILNKKNHFRKKVVFKYLDD